MMNAALPRIAITLGDPAGIGPEIALKAALSARVRRLCRPLLVGDPRVLNAHAEACGLKPNVRVFDRAVDVGWPSEDEVVLLGLELLDREPLAFGEVRPQYGRAGIEAAKAAVSAALGGQVDAVIAGPQSETAIKLAGIVFDGNPSFLARCTGTPVEEVFLMLCFDAFRIVHVTLHVGLARAMTMLSRELIAKTIKATAVTLDKLGITAPRIAVSGVNPHAGEGGMFGSEETEIIEPAVRDAQAAGIDVVGPIGADILFTQQGYDAFVVMYHDQGHIVAKLLATNRAAALSIGTPVLYSSVAHGTAFDIAGRNQATAEAVVEAVERLAGAKARQGAEVHEAKV